MGPVQVLVVGFEHPTFSGEVLAEFDRLRTAGIVRLVDVLLVSRSEDGVLETATPPDGATGPGTLAAALLGSAPDAEAATPDADGAGAPGDQPETASGAEWSLDTLVPPGSAAAVALIEHLWAGPLVTAIERAGGQPLEETWLGPDDRRLLDGLLSPGPG
jgi:hypothetical protein